MTDLWKKLVLALIVLQPACSSSPPAACERIVEACHPKDTGSGKPHDCHEAAEAASATEASCAALEADCLAACK